MSGLLAKHLSCMGVTVLLKALLSEGATKFFAHQRVGGGRKITSLTLFPSFFVWCFPEDAFLGW